MVRGQCGGVTKARRPSGQQSERLAYLRKFGRLRKAFERGGEDGVGVGGTGGRLVELGQRERRAQFETARCLLLRDGDGGLEGFLRRGEAGGIALEQDFAADAMQFCFECAIAGAVHGRQRFVEDGDGAAGIARPGFSLGQRNLNQPVEQQNVLFAQQLDAATHVLEPAAGRVARCGRPALEKHAHARQRFRSYWRASRASSKALGAAREWSPRINSNSAACIFPIRVRTDMRDARDPRLGVVDEGNRATTSP